MNKILIDEATVKLVLEALEELTDTEQTYEALERGDAAITALREALAKLAEQPAPVQEPEWYHFVRRGEDFFVPYEGQAPANATRLYITPQAQPAREWVGLTDEEFEDIELGCRSTPFGKIEAMQKVEAKLKGKNT